MQLLPNGFCVQASKKEIGCFLHPFKTDSLFDADGFMSLAHHRVLLSNLTRGTMTSSIATPP